MRRTFDFLHLTEGKEKQKKWGTHLGKNNNQRTQLIVKNIIKREIVATVILSFYLFIFCGEKTHLERSVKYKHILVVKRKCTSLH